MSFISQFIEQALQNLTMLRRLVYKANVSLNDGLGAYLASMVALAAACVCAWYALEATKPDGTRLRMLETLVPLKQEPLRDESSMTFAGSILLGLENWSLCEGLQNDTTGVFANTNGMADESARLFQEFYNSPHPPREGFKHFLASEFPVVNARMPTDMEWPSSDTKLFAQRNEASKDLETPLIGSAEIYLGPHSMTRVPSMVSTGNVMAPRYSEAHAILRPRAEITFQFGRIV